MKKTTFFFTFLMLTLVMTARPYVPMADSTYIAPEDTAMVTPPTTPPSDDDTQPNIPWGGKQTP